MIPLRLFHTLSHCTVYRDLISVYLLFTLYALFVNVHNTLVVKTIHCKLESVYHKVYTLIFIAPTLVIQHLRVELIQVLPLLGSLALHGDDSEMKVGEDSDDDIKI